MKRLISFVILLTLGITLGLLIANHPGMIRIDTARYHIATSLWVGTIIICFGFFVLQFLCHLIARSLSAPKQLATYIRMTKARKARRLQDDAYRLMIQGHLETAAQRFHQAAKKSNTPSLFHLLSAHCWYELKSSATCRRELSLADSYHQDSDLVDIMKAHLLIAETEYKQAEELLKQHPKHPQANAMLASLALKKKHGEEALTYLNNAKPALPNDAYQNLQDQALMQCLQHCNDESQTKQLHHLWRDYKRVVTQSPTLHAAYLAALHRCGNTASAYKQVVKALHKQWNDAYLNLFQRTAFHHLAESIALAEQWLNQYPNTASIHALLGNLYLETGRHHKAIDHLKEAYASTQSHEAAYKLGQAYTQLGSLEESIRWYAAASDAT